MIVCSCFGVSDHTLRRLVASGVSTVDEIVTACGAGTGCGACASMVSDVLRDGIPRSRFVSVMEATHARSRPDPYAAE